MLHLDQEAARCLLCVNAPCTKACQTGDPARAIRAIRFGNEALAQLWITDCNDDDLRRAEEACIHYDRPIRIREMLREAAERSSDKNTDPTSDKNSKPDATRTSDPKKLPGLEIDFCGIKCENPFFLASSAICTNYGMVARAFEMGWAGVYYKTICKQDIHEVSPRFDAVGDQGQGDFYGFRNMEQLSENPVETDFEYLHRLKEKYPTKVVIASIMGQTEEQWIELAKMAEEAGVDAVELNFSCPQMRLTGMGSDVGQNAELVTFYTAYVKRNVHIPIIPKMTPNITHINQPAMGAYFAGADAVSAINTIKSITMSPQAAVRDRLTVSGYSGRAVKPIALRFIYEMAANPIMHNVQLSGIGGIETWRDALEFIQLGCRNVQICTAVMQYGYRIIDDLILGLQHYMQQRGIEHLGDLVGERLPDFSMPSDLDRSSIVYPVIDRDRCIGCGRCYTSCLDGGHQAISFDSVLRRPRIVGSRCVGCHLCRLVCPTAAIKGGRRITKR